MSDVALLDCIEIEPQEDAEYSVIWLHGLGADGHDFAPVAQMLSSRVSVPIRYILPHAPSMPVTINAGMTMPAWYDMLNLEHPRNVNWDTVFSSEKLIRALIEREKERGVPTSKCILAGFSQGGALALRVALGYESPLAGIMVLSAYLLQKDGESLASADKADIFMAHGQYDPVIPFAIAETSRDVMKPVARQLEWHEYPMEHNVCEDEIRDIQVWLTAKTKV